jgi:CarD family transcriptional regulator
MRRDVILISGNKVVYPSHGPCLIGAVVQKMVNDKMVMFQELLVLSNGGKLFVPIEKVQAIGMRELLKKSEVPKLIDRLKQSTAAAENWRERAQTNLDLLLSGSAFALAQIIESLTELRKTRMLTAVDAKSLARARVLLICEIAEVTGATRDAVEQEIDNALNARTGKGVSRVEQTTQTTERNIGINPSEREELPAALELEHGEHSAPAPHRLKLSWPWVRRR